MTFTLQLIGYLVIGYVIDRFLNDDLTGNAEVTDEDLAQYRCAMTFAWPLVILVLLLSGLIVAFVGESTEPTVNR
jgi:hypothetical protein